MKSSLHKMLFCGVSSLAVYGFGTVGAWAQDAAQGSDTIVVTGIRESLRSSIDVKRNSALVVDAITTQDIGQLPDVTIAEELNRLPGLNTQRDRGNASQAAVRGMGPRLVLGLVNGREVASSEPDQNIRWEIYPSEVVGGVRVYKSQSADLVPGGVAATIDILTTRPLDHTGPSLQFRAGPTYNAEGADLPHYDPWGYRGSIGVFHRLTDDFAIALAGSFQREKNGFPSFQGWGYNLPADGNAGDLNGDGTPDATPWGAQTEIKEITQDRSAVMGAAQWRPNNDVDVNFDMLYSKYKIGEDQFQAWYGNGTWGNWDNGNFGAYNGPGSSYTIVNGSVVAATLANAYSQVNNVIANYNEEHDLFATGLNVAWRMGEWRAKTDLSYSQAKRENRWMSIYSPVFPPTMSFDFRGTPAVTTSSDPADPSIQGAQTWMPGYSDGPEHSRDRITAGTLDLSRDLSGFFTQISFGGRVSERVKGHSDLAFNLCAGSGATRADLPCAGSFVALPASDLSEFTVHGFTVPPMLYGNFSQLAAMVYASTAPPANSENTIRDWSVTEDTFEGYAKADFGAQLGGMDLTGNAGVRIVGVDSTSAGFQCLGGFCSNTPGTPSGSTAFTPVSVSHDYTDVLPSLNLVLHLNDEQLLRFGAAVAIARPPLDELRTGYSLSATPPLTGSGGNPTLDPYKSTQVDLSYEWYFHPESLFALAAYYKNLDTYIGYGTSTQIINGNSYVVGSPRNGNGGYIRGVELTFQTPFFFLPEALQNFGVYANYAYADSDVQEFTPSSNPYVATGLARNTAEFDLWYSNGPLEARAAYKYHSPFSLIGGWDGSFITRLESEKTLDASVSYQINQHFGVRLQARNLLDDPVKQYRDNDPLHLYRYDLFGRAYLLDFSFRY